MYVVAESIYKQGIPTMKPLDKKPVILRVAGNSGEKYGVIFQNTIQFFPCPLQNRGRNYAIYR